MNGADQDAALRSARRAYAAGDLAVAGRAFRGLTETMPALAEPWIILAYIDLQQGRPERALATADKAARLEPGNPFAVLVCCRALLANMQPAQALSLARIAVGPAPMPPVALDGFGLIYLQLGKYETARALFARAVEASPLNPALLYNLAFAEHACGALAEAERHLDQVIELRPDFHVAYFLRSDLRKQTPARNHIAAMETALAAGPRDPSGEIALRFALGKEHEDLGRWRQAMAHIKAGAALQRRSFRYDADADIGFVDRLIAAYDPETIGKLARSRSARAHSADDPIFIVGLPRSGTTLVERIVGAHRRVVAAGELGVMPLELGKAARGAGSIDAGGWIARLDQIDWASLGHDYCRLAREAGHPTDLRFIDKNPANFLLIGAILSALPNAKIIAVRRNPMDTCFAAFKTLFDGAAYPWSYDLCETADYYAAFDRLMAHWRRVVSDQSLREVWYEDLVNDPEGQSRQLLRFLDLPWQDQIMRFQDNTEPTATASAAQVRQPIYRSSVGNWRHFADELAPLRARLASHIADPER